ncbi:MAG: T9SS type A sorting domain-containing protein [Crocinitomicaceae bacterium]|nr:T9SS type A sorting domain-containing protein [Crocinitomicaceae bacterium]
MKKLYTLLACFIFGGVLYAQENSTAETKAEPTRPGLHGDYYQERATPFWTEDFGNGFPAGWAIMDSSGICPWRYSFDGSWGYYSNTGENSGDAPISSTTNGNGFLICDNDSANHVNYGQPSGTTYQYLSSYFGTSAIDCSGHSSVILRFEQMYRYNNGVPMFVQVSTDSSVWTSFDVSGGLANNTVSADPDVEIVNLSSIASNQPTVYLRFGWSARVYYWMIDDLSLSDADPNDVSLESAYWGAGAYQYQHYKIPTTQWSPITFYGAMTNNTGNTINNVYFDIDVNSGAVFSGTSNTMNLAPTQLDTVTSTTDWTPSAVGFFDFTFTADIQGLTDSNLTNNTLTDQIEMTDGVYAMDNLPADLSGSTGSIGNWSGNSGMTFGIGNVHEIIANDEIECVDIGLSSHATNEGQIIYGAVYFWDGSDWVWLGQTNDYVVQNSDLGSLVQIAFPNPVPVTAGQEVVVVAGHYGGTDDPRFLMAQPVANQMVWGFDAGGSWYWLSSPRAVVARANFACIAAGTEELTSVSAISCYPNPAKDLVNVEIELAEASNIGIKVYDINGRLVKERESVELGVGNHVIQLNTDKFEAGTYTVEVTVNDTKTREILVVE